MIFSERYRQDNNLWIPNEEYSFQYSDGDENENYILNAIEQSLDLSIGSVELCTYIRDWPSLYHLSPKRADLLRPLTKHLAGKKILEIGSGCGAITRFLGEINCEVLALEGSSKRARITLGRCRDLNNVQVVSDNFDDFVTNEQFDCITLIGVLEYSNLFIKGDNPPLAMLSKVRQLLKPGGYIIIAIENKLGLKYLAGAPEDHLGTAFFGVENKYTSNTATTFGKEELRLLLRQAALDSIQFLYPFPDYKLPVSIITDNGLLKTDFDVPALLLEKHEYIQGHEYNSFFNVSLVERELHRNRLTGDMANSFLVLASEKPHEILDKSLLAVSYTTSRKKAYCKSVDFVTSPDESVLITKRKIHADKVDNEGISLILTSEPYQQGVLLQELLLRIVSVKNWTIEQLTAWGGQYYRILQKQAQVIQGKIYLDGKYVDLTPFNILIKENGEPFIFDQEWDCKELLPIEYVFFRGVYYSLGQVIFFSIPAQEVPRCVLELSISLLKNFRGIDASTVNDFRDVEKKYFSRIWLQEYEPFTPEPMRIRSYELQHEQIQKNASDMAVLGQLQEEIKKLVQNGQELGEQFEKQLKAQKELSERNDQLEVQGRTLRHELSEKEELLQKFQLELKQRDQILQEIQFNFSLTKQQLAEVNNKLVTIYDSDGWKFLNRYYTVKGKLLNEKSGHYKALRKIVNFLRRRKNSNPGSHGAYTNKKSQLFEDGKDCKAAVITGGLLPVFENPEVSIIIPVYNAWEMNAKCIASIIENTKDIAYELVIADDCSTDTTKDIASYFPNIVHIRNEKNLGFLLNCNNAASYAKGKYIHFLNNDTEVKPGWLSSLVMLMNKDENIGMTGSKLIYPDGRLQEAGGIIWNDASGWNFGHSQNPEQPEFNYVKEVDYISGASIMIRADLWTNIGGFDTDYSPAYCEDSDLAFRVREKGFKVMFQPLSEVIHYEGYSHGSDKEKSAISSAKEYQRINNAKFFQKWKTVLQRDQFPNGEKVFWARDRSHLKKTLLMVDHYVPQFDKDAGSRTTFQYLELFVKMGFNVKFLGENFYKDEPYTTVLQQMGIEVLYGPWYADNWKQWFIDSQEKFDYIYLNRPHISINFIDFFKEHSTARIIYYGHDLHFLRKEKKYALEKDKNILLQAAKWKEIELYLFSKSDIILTPSTDEQKIIQSLNSDFNVQLMRPYIYKTISEPANNFQERKDIFFVGGFGHLPNVDGILWFIKEVWPLIKSKIPGIKFIIAGSNPPQEIKDLASDSDIIIKGYVGDDELEKLYTNCKIVIIPLRYGAGVKGKTVEAMRFGIPLVTTSFGVEGLPGDYSFLKVADTSQLLANAIVDTYNDEILLAELSRKSIQYIQNNFTEEIATGIISKALATG